MKTKILSLLILLSAPAAFSQTNMQYVTIIGAVTNTSSSFYQVTISNGVAGQGITNASMHVVNTNNITVGDPLNIAFTKINLTEFCLTNLISGIVNSLYANWYFATNPSSVHVGIYTNGVYYGTFFGGGNFTNSGLTGCTIVGGSITNSWITNSIFSGDGGGVLNLNGHNLTSGTVVSNSFDADTLTWLQSCIVPGESFTAGAITGTSFAGSLLDSGASSGTTGYIPIANGSGNWTWTVPWVVPDSGGMGGTTLQLNASDTGGAMYVHVNSLGVVTATSSP